MAKPLTPEQREKAKAASRRWYQRNLAAQRLRCRLQKRASYKVRGEEMRAINRKWAKANPEMIRERDLRRRAIQASVTLGDTRLISQWMKEIKRQVFARCHWCGTKVPGRKVHFDHVLPMSKGGAHSISNLCVSCPECNLSKQDRALADWIARGQTFLNL